VPETQGAIVSRSILVLIVALLAGAALLPATAGAARSTEGRYIVVLKESAGNPAEVADVHGKRHGAKRQQLFRSALKGYSARIPADEVAALRRDARVAYVEPDRLMKAQATQTGATWGLDRIDQRTLPLNSTFS
jgi:Peptidase inhibitor I9